MDKVQKPSNPDFEYILSTPQFIELSLSGYEDETWMGMVSFLCINFTGGRKRKKEVPVYLDLNQLLHSVQELSHLQQCEQLPLL